MRLICPNCGAQYAVADDVIPASGRDVQCSNCAHTWFETPGASSNDVAPAPRRTKSAPRPAEPNEGPISDAFKDRTSGDKLAPAPQAPKGRKTVDPEVADILREEAAHEAARRRKEAPAAMESQSDLGLSDPSRAPTKRPPQDSRSAAATAAASTGAVAASQTISSRRELLPDIEDINSSLRSEKDRAAEDRASDAASDIQDRRGFRAGFFLMLLLFALLTGLYIAAEPIKNALPGAAGAIDSYVENVNQARIWLDSTVRSLLTSSNGAES